MGVINVVDEAFPQLNVRRWLVIFGYVVVVHDVRHVSFPKKCFRRWTCRIIESNAGRRIRRSRVNDVLPLEQGGSLR